MSQESSNRAQITGAIVRYMIGLPEPKAMPREVEVIVKFKEGTERHKIALAGD